MECLFNENFAVLGEDEQISAKEVWQAIYMEYLDLSGLAQTTELHLMKGIQTLECRITLVNTAINLHKECLRVIGQPFFPAFATLKKYGHAIWWDKNVENIEAFIVSLDKIAMKEKRYEMELESKKKDLFKFMESIKKREPSETMSRKEFIRMMNQIEKFGFRIDREKNTVEDLAVMQSDYNAACEAAALAK